MHKQTDLKLVKGVLKVLLCFHLFFSELLYSFLIHKHYI